MVWYIMVNTNKTAGKTATESVGVTETQIKKGFEKCETWADADKVIAKMTTDQIIEMRDALVKAKKYVSLTMRDDFVLNLLVHEVDERARQNEVTA
jgi:hypothetical protein